MGGKGKGGTFFRFNRQQQLKGGWYCPIKLSAVKERITYLHRSEPFGPEQARNGPVPFLPSRQPCFTQPCPHADPALTFTPYRPTATPCPTSQAVQRAGSTSRAPAALRVPQRVLLRQGHVQDHARSVGAALWRAHRGVNGVGPCITQRTA